MSNTHLKRNCDCVV